MARKLNEEEQETFNLLLQREHFPLQLPDLEAFSTKLNAKSKADLKPGPESAIWFDDDISGLPPH
jgi:hypothetical protein